jgi:hypothetical protein
MPRQRYSILFAAAIVAASLVATNIAATESNDPTLGNGATANGPKCLEAIVNPVSGHAECVNPRGAPVEQPRLVDLPCSLRDAKSGRAGRNCANDSRAGR